MKRLIIVCEGQTEQEFCNYILQPHLIQFGIVVQNPTIKKTAGGIVNWASLKHQIETHLKQDPTAFVTTLIDFYGIHANHNYPNWLQANQHNNKNIGMDLMEEAMLADIQVQLQSRFIPYIQLHEFEALILADARKLDWEYFEHEAAIASLVTMVGDTCPELINDGAETAPSKRILKQIPEYDKVTAGWTVVEQIGLATLRHKCPHFNEWLTRLEQLGATGE